MTEDYEELNKKYSHANLIEISRNDGQDTKFPEILLAFRKQDEKPFNMQWDKDAEHFIYELPKQVADHSEELMKAHAWSVLYNNVNVRVNGFQRDKDGLTLHLRYGKTTYFDSMVTNRAMDYLVKGKTVREVYEPGPFLSSLEESKMSNHLGFHGFVELSDGIIFTLRKNKDVTTGKDKLGASIQASYKTEYGVDKDFNIDNKTIGDAIRNEIKNELKIDLGKDSKIDIFAFYRDVVEGGKPQFLFYVKYEKTFEKFKNDYKSKMNEKNVKKEDRKKVVTDARNFEHFTRDELKSFSYMPGSMTDTKKGKKYEMMPSSVVSAVLLLAYMGLANVELSNDKNSNDKIIISASGTFDETSQQT